MPRAFIRDLKVDGLTPSSSAAPLSPPTRQPVRSRAAIMLSRATLRNRSSVRISAGAGGCAVRADLVIGADGVRSRVARLAGAAVERSGRHTCAVIYGYFEGMDVRGSHWHYAPRGQRGGHPHERRPDLRVHRHGGTPVP